MNMLTRDEVARRVEIVEEAANDNDDELAHNEEDDLYRDVLEAIALGTCSDPVGCATEAIGTQDFDFKRRCA